MHYSCTQIKKLLAEGGHLIDVRTPAEFAQGALPSAVNIPLNEFMAKTARLDNKTPVLLYCRSGQRSGMAQKFLQSKGFAQAHNIGAYQSYVNCA